MWERLVVLSIWHWERFDSMVLLTGLQNDYFIYHFSLSRTCTLVIARFHSSFSVFNGLSPLYLIKASNFCSMSSSDEEMGQMKVQVVEGAQVQ